MSIQSQNDFPQSSPEAFREVGGPRPLVMLSESLAGDSIHPLLSVTL